MQNIPPALLSYGHFRNHSYIIQEMQPTKDTFNFKLIRDAYRDIYQVINDMAILTASAQIRSSGWKGASVVDELSAFGENNQWQHAVLEFARNYSQTVKNDFQDFCKSTLKNKTQSSSPAEILMKPGKES